MYQIKNAINRTSVPSYPERNMNTAEDFMLLLVHTHVVAAAEAIQSITPSDEVMQLAKAVVTNYVRLPRADGKEAETCDDRVHVYATELLSLGLLWHGFHDSIREGDGERILTYWKILLVVFKSSNNHNYAKEAGYQGKNIPCDLFMEHLNRRLKMILRSLGANVTPKLIQKAGRVILPVQQVCQAFEQQTATNVRSGHHTVPAFGKDFTNALQIITEERVFFPERVRSHSTFKSNCTLIEKYSSSELENKVDKSLKQLYML